MGDDARIEPFDVIALDGWGLVVAPVRNRRNLPIRPCSVVTALTSWRKNSDDRKGMRIAMGTGR